MHRRLSTRSAATVARRFALVAESFGETTAEIPQRAVGVVGVVTVDLPGGDDMRGVVGVIVPLRRRVQRTVTRIAPQIPRLVVVVFENDVGVPNAPRSFAHPRGELGDKVGRRIVDDAIHGVEAQAVEPVLLQPVQRVVDEKVAHRSAVLSVHIDRGAPRSLMTRVEKRRRIRMEVVAFRAEVVVNDIEQHHERARMRGIDEALEVIGTAVR